MTGRRGLTDSKVTSAKPGAHLRDGACRNLALRVTAAGLKMWIFRKMKVGQDVHVVLGHYPEVTLAKARELADGVRPLVGVVPVEEIRARVAQGNMTQPAVELAKGDALATEVTEWLAKAKAERRAKTMEAYAGAARRFLDWAAEARVNSTADLTRAQLSAFRAYLLALPRHVAAKGSKTRGKKVATEQKRSAASVNRELRSVGTMLNALRRDEKLPHIDRDAIADCLRAADVDKVRPSRMKAGQIKKLLEACDRHDAATFKVTRDGEEGVGRHVPMKGITAFMLLTGMRLGEALSLTWDDVDLETKDHDDRPIGQLELRAGNVKTASDRTVYLNVCPTVRRMLAAMRLASGGKGRVWDGYTEEMLTGARRRLHAEYGAPEFLWSTQHSKGGERSPPTLRSTCATFLHSAPGIYGGGSALHLACAQLGHSPEVARKHYATVETNITRDARTLEAAMRIEELVADVGVATGRRSKRARV